MTDTRRQQPHFCPECSSGATSAVALTGHHFSRRDLLKGAAGITLGGAASLTAIDRVAQRYLSHAASHTGHAAAQGNDPLQFGQQIITPDGTPLGGSVNLDIWPDGRYHIKFHMHSSSIFGDFDYMLRAYLTAPDFPTLFLLHSGHVSGVDSSDHEEDGYNALIPLYWDQLVAGGVFNVGKDYKWGGIVGGILDIPSFVAELLGFGVDLIAGGLGAIIGGTLEAASALGIDFGPGGTLGVLGGVVVFGVGLGFGLPLGASLILGTVAGVGIGAVANDMIASRPLNDGERALAWSVFGDTVPMDIVMLTNLVGASNRAFTVPGADGKIYINVGWRFADPINSVDGSYPVPGQLLIHELTHAWQIARKNFVPGYMCSAFVEQAHTSLGDSAYKYGDAGPNWGDFKQEQQASIVDDWFAGTDNSAGYRPMDQGSPYYRYIWNDLLAKNIPFTAPGNLRSASGMAISPHYWEIDVCFATPDGNVAESFWQEPTGWNGPVGIANSGTAANAAISMTTRIETLEMFWPGPDGSVWHQWYAGGIGTAHTIAGAGSTILSSPTGFAQTVSVSCKIPGHIDIFWVAPDGSIVTVWWDENGNFWSEPFAITGPGVAAGAVATVARRPDQVDVFWVAPDGSVMGCWWGPNNGWSAPYGIAGPGSAVPTTLGVCCKVTEHIDVFWVTPDGSIATTYWNVDGWHTPFSVAGPGTAAGGISAIARTPEHVVVFYVSPDGSIGNAWWGPSDPGWRAPFSITGPGSAGVASPIRALARTPNLCDVFWIAPDGSIHSNWFDGSTWRGEFTVAGAGSAATPPASGGDELPVTATADDSLDSDGDGLFDDEEVTSYGTDPMDPDTDGDGVSDDQEVKDGTNPLDPSDYLEPDRPDTDMDGLYDDDETDVYGTDPLLWDTDGDGVSDGQEVYDGTDPLDPASFSPGG